MDWPSIAGLGVRGRFAGCVVYVFAAYFFTHAGRPSVGMFLT
jgi:hypothetical protein